MRVNCLLDTLKRSYITESLEYIQALDSKMQRSTTIRTVFEAVYLGNVRNQGAITYLELLVYLFKTPFDMKNPYLKAATKNLQ